MSSPFFISRRPLVAAILLGLSLPVLADDAAQLDRVVVKGSRYLPEYQARDSRSATKTDTPLVNVPQAATVVTEELIRDQAMTGGAFDVRATERKAA